MTDVSCFKGSVKQFATRTNNEKGLPIISHFNPEPFRSHARTLADDLPRTIVIPTSQGGAQQIVNAASTAALGQNEKGEYIHPYLQGDATGTSAIRLEYQAEMARLYELTRDETYRVKPAVFCTSYINDRGIPCGAVIIVNKDYPELWSMGVVENTFASDLDARRMTRFSTVSAQNKVSSSDEVVIDDFKSAIGSEKVAEKIFNTDELPLLKDGKINKEKVQVLQSTMSESPESSFSDNLVKLFTLKTAYEIFKDRYQKKPPQFNNDKRNGEKVVQKNTQWAVLSEIESLLEDDNEQLIDKVESLLSVYREGDNWVEDEKILQGFVGGSELLGQALKLLPEANDTWENESALSNLNNLEKNKNLSEFSSEKPSIKLANQITDSIVQSLERSVTSLKFDDRKGIPINHKVLNGAEKAIQKIREAKLEFAYKLVALEKESVADNNQLVNMTLKNNAPNEWATQLEAANRLVIGKEHELRELKATTPSYTEDTPEKQLRYRKKYEELVFEREQLEKKYNALEADGEKSGVQEELFAKTAELLALEKLQLRFLQKQVRKAKLNRATQVFSEKISEQLSILLPEGQEYLNNALGDTQKERNNLLKGLVNLPGSPLKKECQKYCHQVSQQKQLFYDKKARLEDTLIKLQQDEPKDESRIEATQKAIIAISMTLLSMEKATQDFIKNSTAELEGEKPSADVLYREQVKASQVIERAILSHITHNPALEVYEEKGSLRKLADKVIDTLKSIIPGYRHKANAKDEKKGYVLRRGETQKMADKALKKLHKEEPKKEVQNAQVVPSPLPRQMGR